MSKNEIVKTIIDNLLKGADAANSAELAYVESLNKKNQNKQQKEAEREL